MLRNLQVAHGIGYEVALGDEQRVPGHDPQDLVGVVMHQPVVVPVHVVEVKRPLQDDQAHGQSWNHGSQARGVLKRGQPQAAEGAHQDLGLLPETGDYCAVQRIIHRQVREGGEGEHAECQCGHDRGPQGVPLPFSPPSRCDETHDGKPRAPPPDLA